MLFEFQENGKISIILSKQNLAIEKILPQQGIQAMRELSYDINFLFDVSGFKYLASSKPSKPQQSKDSIYDNDNLTALVNKDLKFICQQTNLPKFFSHSFRIGYLTQLLQTNSAHIVANLIGHKQSVTTEKYYRHATENNRNLLQKSFDEFIGK